MCKIWTKNSQPFGKKCQKTSGGYFFDSHCTTQPRSPVSDDRRDPIWQATLCRSEMGYNSELWTYLYAACIGSSVRCACIAMVRQLQWSWTCCCACLSLGCAGLTAGSETNDQRQLLDDALAILNTKPTVSSALIIRHRISITLQEHVAVQNHVLSIKRRASGLWFDYVFVFTELWLVLSYGGTQRPPPRKHTPLFPQKLTPLFPQKLTPLFPHKCTPLFPRKLTPLFPQKLTPLFPCKLTPLFPHKCTPLFLHKLTPLFPQKLTPLFLRKLTPLFPRKLTPLFPRKLTPNSLHSFPVNSRGKSRVQLWGKSTLWRHWLRTRSDGSICRNIYR